MKRPKTAFHIDPPVKCTVVFISIPKALSALLVPPLLTLYVFYAYSFRTTSTVEVGSHGQLERSRRHPAVHVLVMKTGLLPKMQVQYARRCVGVPGVACAASWQRDGSRPGQSCLPPTTGCHRVSDHWTRRRWPHGEGNPTSLDTR